MRRHRSRTVPMNEAEEASQFYDFSTDLEFNDLLKTLPEDSRLIFQMYYGEQFSIGEIAQLLHMKENTVKSKIHRGREHLRSQMGVGKENSCLLYTSIIPRYANRGYGAMCQWHMFSTDRSGAETWECIARSNP